MGNQQPCVLYFFLITTFFLLVVQNIQEKLRLVQPSSRTFCSGRNAPQLCCPGWQPRELHVALGLGNGILNFI